MNIFIANDYEGSPIGVLLADSREKADLVWMGMKLAVHEVEEIDISESKGIHGVVTLFTTEELELRNTGTRTFKYRKWKRGG